MSVSLLNLANIFSFQNKSNFFEKWVIPCLFFVYFRLFKQTNITIFTTNKCEKMSIQYTTALGFEPMTNESNFWPFSRTDGIDHPVWDQREGLDVASGQEATGADWPGDERRPGKRSFRLVAGRCKWTAVSQEIENFLPLCRNATVHCRSQQICSVVWTSLKFKWFSRWL